MLASAATAAGLPQAQPPVLQADLEPAVTVQGFAFTADQRLANGTQRRIELDLPELRDWRDVLELASLGDPGTYRATFTMGPLEAGRRYFLQLDRVCDRGHHAQRPGPRRCSRLGAWRLPDCCGKARIP